MFKYWKGIYQRRRRIWTLVYLAGYRDAHSIPSNTRERDGEGSDVTTWPQLLRAVNDMHVSIIRKMSPLFSLMTMPLSHIVGYTLHRHVNKAKWRITPFSTNDMILSNVAVCPLHRHVNEWNSTPFRLDPIFSPDRHVSEAKWRSFLFNWYARRWYLDIGSLESARAFNKTDKNLESRLTVCKTASGMILIAIRFLPNELNVHEHCSHTGQRKN